MAQGRSMEARTGRTQQRYGLYGERLVAGVVALTADYQHVLLVQSTSRKGWVLPKGGWESDEATASDAALREAWEEAGIVCHVLRPLGEILDFQESAQTGSEQSGKKHDRKTRYYFYEVVVEKEEAVYPEVEKRSRAWCTYSQAREALQNRPELLAALEQSSLVR